MQPSIREFSSSDWGQYFNDTYVQFQSKSGVRIGRIETFTEAERVIVNCNGSSRVIEVGDILWRGLIRTRCVVWQDRLAFVGPSGARSHKKPPHGGNMSALLYHRGSIPIILGGRRGNSVDHDLILAYLSDDDVYPATRQDTRTLLANRRAVALSPRCGIFLSRHDDHYYGLADGLVVQSTTNQSTILTWAEEARHNVA